MRLPIPTRHVPMLATAIVLLGAFAFGAMMYPNFASWGIVRNLIVDNAFLGVAAVGATFVILSGGIDLSVGSVMALTSILVASLIERHVVHPTVAISLGLVLGSLFGLAQGAMIQSFRLPPFLITLGGMFLARGLAFWIHPQSLGIRHEFVGTTLNETLSFTLPLGPRGITFPITVDIFLLVVLAALFTLTSTKFGRAVHAIGDDEHAAALMGLPVARTRVLVYTVSGFLSAVAGIVFALYQQSGDPASCKGLELDAIAAVVIGGTLLRGGVGSVVGTVMGVMILGLIQTLIAFQSAITDMSSWWTRIIVGGLVLGFLVLQRGVEWVGRART